MKTLTYLFIGFYFTATLISCAKEVPGCTDSNSQNFDSEANIDDGSCLFLRDQYTGNFIGAIDATDDKYDDSEFGIRISPDVDNTSQVVISFACCPSIKFSGIASESMIKVDSKVVVTGFPGCNGTTPFNGFVEWKVDFRFRDNNNSFEFDNLVERYLDQNRSVICLTEYTGELNRS